MNTSITHILNAVQWFENAVGVGCAFRYNIELYVPNQHTQRPTQNLGSSNNSNKNTPPTNQYHDLPGSCVQRVYKHFYSGLWLLLLMWLNIILSVSSFIHSMLSFDQKRRLFVDRWFFLFHRVCTIPVGYIYVHSCYVFTN